MDSIDDMPFRKYMNPKVNPLLPDSKLPVDIPVEYQTDIEIIHGNRTDKRYNPLMPGSPLDASPCGPDCERKAFIQDLRALGADQDEIDNALSGWTPEPGCHECSC